MEFVLVVTLEIVPVDDPAGGGGSRYTLVDIRVQKNKQALLTDSRFGGRGNGRGFFSIGRRIVTIITRVSIVGSTRAQDLEMTCINIIAIILDAKAMNCKLGHSCRDSSQKHHHRWHKAS